MKKYFSTIAMRIVLLLCFCCFLCSLSGASGVITTKEPTDDEYTVYVAGNPKLYPVEFYNPKTNSYEGIMPAILEQVSERTGLRFAYIQAGEQDQRERLAKNGQVEIVSGYRKEESFSGVLLQKSSVLFTFTKDGKQFEVCFAFTQLASDELISTMNRALSSISDREITDLSISQAMNSQKRNIPLWVLVTLIIVGTVLLGTVIMLAVKVYHHKKANKRDEMSDINTGIGNKKYFTHYFERYISDQSRAIYFVAYIGFDIARVNRYYGEEEAENELRYAASELTKHAADGDIVARVSGGGFAVAHAYSGESEAKEWVCDTLRRLNLYGEKFEKDFHPNFRCGIYFMKQDDRDCETVLYNAKQGYHHAIETNTTYAISNAKMIQREKEKAQLQQNTVNALQNREFKLFMQFFVKAGDDSIAGAEALARWEHPQKGLLLPERFITVLTQEGNIAALDFYMFEESCAQLQQWKREGRTFYLSCNFARSTIDIPDFVRTIKKIAGKYSFNYERLIIEITEEVMENNENTAYQNVSECKKLGFKIALDDVGSGVTSFSDLRDYPIDIVKVDKSIVKSINTEQGVALLKGMVALAHSLNMQVLCEGVETVDEAVLLRQIGSDYLQGHYFYRAMPKNEVDRYLQNR